MKTDNPYLEHILDAISKIEDYLSDSNHDEFLNDSMTQDAVVRNLEIIGEATKRISKETRQTHPEIPWSEIAGTRDRLIHAYFDVDLNEVWIMVERDVPLLKSAVAKILAELGDSRGRTAP